MWLNKEQTWLLQAALLEGSASQEMWEKWSQVIDFDQIDPASYKLLPLLCRNPALANFQGSLFEKCKGVYRKTWVANRLHWEKMIPVLKELRERGVDRIIVLKGMAMILQYYEDFGLRVIGDVDILIRKKDLSFVANFLYSDGWKSNISRFDFKDPEHLSRWHALNFTHGNGMNLDVHWSFVQENSQALDEAVFEGAREIFFKNIRLYVPNPTDLLLQTCLHGMKYSPVPLIRWVADARIILKRSKNEIDWKRFVDLAYRAKISRPLSLGLQYLVESFAAPISQHVIEQLKSSIPSRLERLEYKWNVQGNLEAAAWCRYCLNRGYFSLGSQLIHFYRYLYITARSKSLWRFPFFLIYWLFKRIIRRMTGIETRYAKDFAGLRPTTRPKD